jgi:hypothetical protein
MIFRSLLLSVLILVPLPSLAADEIELEYVETDVIARMFQSHKLPQNWREDLIAGTFPSSLLEHDRRAVWTNGADVLSAGAFTFVNGGWIMSLDKRAEGARHPDTLYVDVNGNETLDAGEAFALEPERKDSEEEPGAFGNPLVARKVPCAAPAGASGERFINISLMQNETLLYVGTGPWGCLAGRGTLGGRPCTATLYDENVSGTFTDFAGTEAGRRASRPDTITLKIDGKSALTRKPLRKKMMLSGTVYEVAVAAGGAKLVIDPIETETGAVSVAGNDIEVVLSNPEWGDHTVQSGKDAVLPAGIYKVSSFTRKRSDPYTRCSYTGPAEMEIDIAPGSTASVELETVLNARVETRRSRRNLVLSLTMTTSQGARFRSYAATAESPQLQGVPFFITDGAGGVLVEDIFRFG